MENSASPPPDNSSATAGPGRLLLQARKDLRLAPEDVAQILHLSPKQITALEKDDYDSLPGPTYIRGYLRNYAQLLGLSPDQILESYGRLMTPAKPMSLPKSAPPPQVTSSDRMVKLASAGVSAVVLGLVFLWWRSDEIPSEQISSPPAVVGQTSATEPDRAGSMASNSASQDDSVITSSSNPPPSAHSVLTPNSAAPAVPPPAIKAGAEKNQQTVSGAKANASLTQSPKQISAPVSAPADRVLIGKREPVDIPPGAARSRLVLHATQESWADVRDARDNKLLYENVPAGRSIAIEGVAPISVFLGNADGVRVEFNGQNFDVSRYRRGQVARFTLGENPAVNN